MIPFPRVTAFRTRSGARTFRDRQGRIVSPSVALWLCNDLWAFLDKDEHYVPDHGGSFVCIGCNTRRPNSCGGDDGTAISRVCDFCTAKTWNNLAAAVKAIAIHQQNLEGA